MVGNARYNIPLTLRFHPSRFHHHPWLIQRQFLLQTTFFNFPRYYFSARSLSPVYGPVNGENWPNWLPLIIEPSSKE